MDPSRYTVRRATLEDLPTLKGLWQTNGLPALELDRHLTEFQLVLRPDGILVCAIALRVIGAQGLIHSEAGYSTQQLEDGRPLFWQRLQGLARNHGLTRLWARGEVVPFWRDTGFRTATEAELKRLPTAFGSAEVGWSTLNLRDEVLLADALEKELELFHQEQQEQNERLRRQALLFKWIAGLIAVGFFAGALALLFQILNRSSRRARPK